MSNTTGTYTNASTWGANAYFLRIDGWIVKPSSEDVRWLGFPVRCLVYIVKKRKTLYFVRSGWLNLDNSALWGFRLQWRRLVTQR